MNRVLVLAVACALSTGAFALSKPEPDLCAVVPGAQPRLPAKLLEGQGVTDMQVTTQSPQARAFFNQGVSQLHSFWAQEAERSFLQAAEYDPGMAMAYWGMAVAAAGDHRSSFQLMRSSNEGGRKNATSESEIARSANGAALDGQIRAREYIAKAMSMRGAVSARERLYIEAQAARRDPESKNPDADFIAGMRKLVAAYPDDLDARSFLGLVLLYGYEEPSKKPRPGTLEGIAFLEGVVAQNDNHFGAHHYLIHAYENSKTPEKAWHSSERYPQMVNNIPHALHMPGHIYIQSDRLDDAVASFTVAGANELSYINADPAYPNGHHGHNIHFLIHALGIEGRYAESLLQAQSLLSFKETPRERSGDNQRVTWRQGHFSLIKTLVRFERWHEILDGRTIPIYDKPEQQALRAWAMGLAHSALGNPVAAKASLDEMHAAISKAKATVNVLRIAELELQGTLAVRASEVHKGEKMLADAALKESSLIYQEPPAYPRPVAEGWGSVALSVKDFAMADRAFAEALVLEPGSGRAYLGRSKALAGLGKSSESASMLQKARVAWNHADVELPETAALRVVSTASLAEPVK
ncbi:MAG: hypothetical protein WDO68_30535 [Gammaproteobacteria bacterium]